MIRLFDIHNGIKEFLKYLVVWISQNLAIPFWTVGHIHLMTTIYEDIHEVLVSCGMNIVVLLGFILSYYEQHKNKLNDTSGNS